MVCAQSFQFCLTLCDPMDRMVFSTLWNLRHPVEACQAPLSMGFSRQESWSELPCPPPGDLPDPGIKPGSPALQVDALPTEPPGKPKWFDILCHKATNYGKFLKRWEYQITCLLRNLYAGQEATERDMEQLTGLKLGKEDTESPRVTWAVTQGLLSPCVCLLNLHPEYSMPSAERDES